MDSVEYEIYDNGAVPFIVTIFESKKIAIVTRRYNDVYASVNDKIIQVHNYSKIFIGKDPYVYYDGKEYDGNSILLQIGLDHYVYIGSEIYKFMTSEKILSYVSEMGNNWVPYPYIIGETNIYLMLDKIYFPKSLYDDNIENAYNTNYGDEGKTFDYIIIENPRLKN